MSRAKGGALSKPERTGKNNYRLERIILQSMTIKMKESGGGGGLTNQQEEIISNQNGLEWIVSVGNTPLQS